MDCSELTKYDLSDGLPAAILYENSPVLEFSQSCLASTENGFRSGEIRLGRFGGRFFFDGKLEDERIFTSAQKRNEMLYLLGDILELFAGIKNDPAYLDHHYAPNEVILQLLWPRPIASIDLKSSGGVEAFAIFDNFSRHAVERISGGWRVNAQVPLTQSGNSSESLAGVALDMHFGRHDYSDLPRASFHDRANWRNVLCTPTKSP